jgi:hypothetical protein
MSRHNPYRAPAVATSPVVYGPPPVAVAPVAIAPAPEAVVAALLGSAPTDPTQEPAIMKFASVHLDVSIPRVSAEKGLANSETSYFDVERSGVTIELDVATGLVRLSKNDVEAFVPVSKVTRFGARVS